MYCYIFICFFFFFFFSSRRRHTRSDRDWSSDVCSSDLSPHGPETLFPPPFGEADDEEPGTLRRTDHGGPGLDERSEERRVGKEGRSRWAADHLKKKKKKKIRR